MIFDTKSSLRFRLLSSSSTAMRQYVRTLIHKFQRTGDYFRINSPINVREHDLGVQQQACCIMPFPREALLDKARCSFEDYCQLSVLCYNYSW